MDENGAVAPGFMPGAAPVGAWRSVTASGLIAAAVGLGLKELPLAAMVIDRAFELWLRRLSRRAE